MQENVPDVPENVPCCIRCPCFCLLPSLSVVLPRHWISIVNLLRARAVCDTAICTCRAFPAMVVLLLVRQSPEYDVSIRVDDYYAMKKVFTEIFEKFRSFCVVFRSFREFFEAFRRVRTHSDPFGPIEMHSDAFGSNWKRLDVFEKF